MKDYKFGLKVQPVSTSGGDTDYSVSQQAGTSAPNEHNPYGISYFDDPSYMIAAGGERITSIPSPYARMHITDIAFREYVSGKGVMSESDLKKKALSDDYIRTISHCLDMFEMMYRLTDLDLLDHNIAITINNLVTPNTPGLAEAAKGNPNLKKYIETLQLFRNAYNQVIKGRILPGRNYYYDFTNNYLFKYNGSTFGATSPFSGFFTKADCNLVNENGEAVLVFNNHNFLTSAKADWQLFDDRDSKFLKFMYLLLNDTGLSIIYKNLFEALKLHVDAVELDKLKFAEEFPDFNLGPKAGELPKVETTRGDTYVRPNNIDRCYLKYILYLEKPFDFSVDISEFKKPIEDRLSPDGTRPMPWLSVNDLLSDSLVVLPYDVDDKYEAIEYLDESTKHTHRRCLIPIKQEALNYVELSHIIKGLRIRKFSNSHYCVLLTLRLTTGGKIELRRDYYAPNSANGICCYPNGVIVHGADMKQFVFGIYPFVKSKKFENIYKVMFYNDFENKWNLRFFYETDGRIAKFPDAQVLKNITNTVQSGGTYYPHNCTYYEVSGGTLEDSEGSKVGIRFAELKIEIPVKEKAGTLTKIEGTALIVPKLPIIEDVDANETTIAIDLGTSNTYMAYYHTTSHAGAEAEIMDFSTIHGSGAESFLELEFMHKDVDKKTIPTLADFYQDAILTDGTGEEALSAQLSEFIPARIVNKDEEIGFRFPIPSVINRLRSQNGNDGMSPLINRSIPFAYYSIGWRKDEQKNVDIDNIAEGRFKWFFGKDKAGIYRTDAQKKNDFVAFMSELLFIVRSNMLCNGYDLHECKIIWTYPLSFQSALVRNYTKEWEVNFCKFFHPNWLNPAQTGILPNRQEDVKQYIKSTNESLTPFFACCDDPGSVHHLNLVVDMGGGSTDIIGYRDNEAKFITSFGFAGNSLYLDGNLNHKDVKKENNYITHHLEIASESLKSQKHALERTRRINLDAPVSSLMNYGFTQNPEDFENIFMNPIPRFMLQIHNAALFYHIAQVCHAMVPDEMPVNIYLTGNGSKLISMADNFETALKYLRKAFQTVYGKTAEEVKTTIEVTPYRNPKAATVYGALEGNRNEVLSFNDDARRSRVVAFGDEETIKRIDVVDDGIPTPILVGKEGNVYKNVLKFIDMFYEAYGNSRPIMSKEDMIKCLDYIKGDEKNKVNGDFLSDSLFFQYISLLMEQVSRKLLKK
ncbi:MAG: hypothetical protein K2H46_03455 [Muribaculaceae bacterium]|nr:hypothetical protein [Muribaculaceae bacterium]